MLSLGLILVLLEVYSKGIMFLTLFFPTSDLILSSLGPTVHIFHFSLSAVTIVAFKRACN